MKVIKRGLDIPLVGEPSSEIDRSPTVSRVALVGDDYIDMKPTMLVQEGDRVKLGQPVFEDKKTEGVIYTAPGCGEVVEINRGAKRKFLSLVIRLDGDDEEVFQSYGEAEIDQLDRQTIVNQLVASGQWTAFRTRPYSKVPAIDSTPAAIFVTAIDTNPHAPDPVPIIEASREAFSVGLKLLTKLSGGPVFLCTRPGATVPGEGIDRVQVEEFAGPHPAGLPGTHIHFLMPVGVSRSVWHLNYQEVIAFGELFLTGRISTSRIVSLAGPCAKNPRLIQTRLGADLNELLADEATESNVRKLSGSVLDGRQLKEPVGFLSRHHLQVSIIKEGNERIFLGWQRPGFDKFSVTRAFASAFSSGKKFALTTSTEGSKRAMVPIGSYEKVMPLDILPTQLLRALIVGDTEQAQALGCLELAEEDLALCTFVCPGKYEYGSILRDNLTRIEKEG